MWEGIDEPLDEGNWEVIGPSPLPYGDGLPHAPRGHPRRPGQGRRRLRRRRPTGGRRRLRPHRGPRRPRLPALLVPLPGRQPARPTSTADRWPNRLRFPLEVFDAVRAAVPATRPRHRAHLGTDWIAGRQHRRRRGRDRAGVRRARRRRRSTSPPARSPRRRQPAFGRSYQTPVRRQDPSRVAAPAGRQGDRRRRHLLLRRRQLDPARRPRGPVRAGPYPPVRPALDAARRRRAGVQGRARSGRPLSGRPAQAADVAHRQDPAAPAAAARGRQHDQVHVRWTPEGTVRT